MKKIYHLSFLLSLASFASFSAFAKSKRLFINEIAAANASIFKDEAGEYDDFIEIYNTEKIPVDVSGMYLTDRLGSKNKWRIPDSIPDLTTIPPNGFLVIWCDDDTAQGLLHASFKLDNSGESIYLFAMDGKTLIDSVRYPKQYLDFTYGRLFQGNEWSYFLAPSPWMANKGKVKISDVSPPPSFVSESGFYNNSFSLEIMVPENCRVFYQIGGAEPDTEKSAIYSAPFEISKNTVIRARAYREGYLPSEIITATYFINEKVTVPVVSLVTDPINLWDGEDGIYTNPFANMEKTVNFQYFTQQGKEVVNIQMAIKIFGNTSRNSSKQSFSVIAREKFGTDRIEYPFFSDKPHIKSVDGVILRGDVTSGRGGGDRETAGDRVKNELMFKMIQEAGSHVDAQAYQQVVLFINGSYWGLYNLMERKGKDFIRNNHGVKDVDIIYAEYLKVVEGDSLHYLKMLEYMKRNDLENDSVFERLYSMMDVESLMDYWIFEIYSATHDYRVNIRMWRPKTPDGKWRWIAFDEDSWGKVDEKSLHDFTSEDYPSSIYILGAMFLNEKFRIRFINRYADLLNTVLLPKNVHRLIDEIQGVIKDEKQRDYDRWRNLVNFVKPGSQIAMLKEFAEKRPDTLRNEVLERFELLGMTTVKLNVEGKGKILVNTITPTEFPWSGIYFKEIPVQLTAIPEPGHRFKGWSDAKLGQRETVTVNLQEDEYILTALFE